MSPDPVLERIRRANPADEREFSPPPGGAARLRVAARPRHARRRVWVSATATGAGLIAVIALLVIALPRGQERAPSGEPPAPTVGVEPLEVPTGEPAPAPDLRLPLLWPSPEGSREIRLTDLRGQWVVVTFVASWCDPCRQDVRLLGRLAEDRPDLRVLIVATRDLAEPARRTVPSGPDHRVASDPDGRGLSAFGGVGVPTSVVVNPAGVVTAMWNGSLAEADVPRLLAAAGADAPPDGPLPFPGAGRVAWSAAPERRIPVPTPIGTAWVRAGSGADTSPFTLRAAAMGIAVLERREGDTTCIHLAPVNTLVNGAVGCDTPGGLRERGAVFGVASGDGRTFHVAIPPGRTAAPTLANGTPALTVDGVAFATAGAGTDVVFSSGDWSARSAGASP